jgi:hypothetical protein
MVARTRIQANWSLTSITSVGGVFGLKVLAVSSSLFRPLRGRTGAPPT